MENEMEAIKEQLMDKIRSNEWELEMLEQQIEMGLAYRASDIEKLREYEAENRAYNNVLKMISEEVAK